LFFTSKENIELQDNRNCSRSKPRANAEMDGMIPDSAGATPYGIFRLADDYLRADRAAAVVRSRSRGPTRLLCYHAAELFLKTFLRSNGLSVESLRNMQHDIPVMIDEALALGSSSRDGWLKGRQKSRSGMTTSGSVTWLSKKQAR